MVGPDTSWAARIRSGDIVQMFLEQEGVASGLQIKAVKRLSHG